MFPLNKNAKQPAPTAEDKIVVVNEYLLIFCISFNFSCTSLSVKLFLVICLERSFTRCIFCKSLVLVLTLFTRVVVYAFSSLTDTIIPVGVTKLSAN